MLSKQDLDQIRNVVREEVENEVSAARDEIQTDVVTSKMFIQEDIAEVKDRVKNVEITAKRMHRELKNEIKLVLHFLDKENVKTVKRVKRLEEHVGISS